MSQLPFSESAGANLRGFDKNMVNRAKSDALKVQIARKKRDDLMAQAVTLFHAKQLDSDTGKPMSMRKLCHLVSDDHYA